jgi:IS1 family transposase
MDELSASVEKLRVSKSKTCLVESMNSSMRGGLARLKRKTKARGRSTYVLRAGISLRIHIKMRYLRT